MASLLSTVKTKAAKLPSRTFLYAREKWGKSSLFAHAPGAIFFMTRGETGLVELISGGRVPATAHFDYLEKSPPTWLMLRQAVRELLNEEHPYKLLVIDTCNGAEILCEEHIRKVEFGGSLAKFNSYGKGWNYCRSEWTDFLADLDRLRSGRQMGLVLLAHTKVKRYEDPTTEDGYERFQPACNDKIWELTHKWADIICFGHFEAETFETDSGKTRARPVQKRVLCFDQSPQYDAGNRYGITGKIDVSRGAEAGYKAFSAAVRAARAGQDARPDGTSARPAEPQAEPTPEVFPDNPAHNEPEPAETADA